MSDIDMDGALDALSADLPDEGFEAVEADTTLVVQEELQLSF